MDFSEMLESEQITIIRFGEIGDTIALIPALAQLKLLGFRNIRLVFENATTANRFDASRLSFLLSQFCTLHPIASRLDLANPFSSTDEINALRAGSFAFMNQVDGGTKQWLFSAALTLRFKKHPSQNLSANPITNPQKPKPEWLRLVEIVSTSYDLQKIDKKINDALTGAEKKLLSARLAALISGPYGVICIGAKRETNKWSLKNFLSLKKYLENILKIKIYVLGLNKDAEFRGERIAESEPGNLVGGTSLEEAFVLLKNAAFCVTNDSGLAHLSGLSATKTIVLFSGRDQFGKWIPYGKNVRSIVKPISCSPCMSEVCVNNHECLDLISADEVVEEVMDFTGLRGTLTS